MSRLDLLVAEDAPGLKPVRCGGYIQWAKAHCSHPLRVAAMFVAVAMGASLTGCKSVPPPKPLDQLTAQEQAGHTAFLNDCAACHYDREGGSLHGPSLMGVYKQQYLPSGAPVNDERITNTIQHGRGNMPALGYQVSPDDIRDILAYLKTL